MEIMKEAVEKSSVVLVCLSQKYKDSPSCRTGEKTDIYFITRQVTRATHMRNRVCPRFELILKIIIILLIIFLGFIKCKPC